MRPVVEPWLQRTSLLSMRKDGDGIRPGPVVQDQVLVRQVGVGARGSGGDLDQPLVDRAPGILDRALVQRAAGGLGRAVPLDRAQVHVLPGPGQIGPVEVALGPRALQAAVQARLDQPAAQVGFQAAEAGVPAHRREGLIEEQRAQPQVLQQVELQGGPVSEARVQPGVHQAAAAGHPLHDHGPGPAPQHHGQVREAGPRRRLLQVHEHGIGKLHALRDVEQRAVAQGSQVPGGDAVVRPPQAGVHELGHRLRAPPRPGRPGSRPSRAIRRPGPIPCRSPPRNRAAPACPAGSCSDGAAGAPFFPLPPPPAAATPPASAR